MTIGSDNRQQKGISLFNPDTLRTKRFISVADLRPINNLKSVFKKIRDYCAGNVTGITRDEKIAQNMMRLLFCKIYDEKTMRIIQNSI